MATFQHSSSIKPNEVSDKLRSGTFALKWPEETSKLPIIPIAVHLSIDKKGFYLICSNKITKEIECFDIALIHDTRTGSQVSLPQGVDGCNHMNIGNELDVPLTSKWVTITYGNTFVANADLRIIHFSFESSIVAREWAEQLFRYGHNPYLRNLSSLECLEKIHSKIINGLIKIHLDKRLFPVQSLIQFLCKNNHNSHREEKEKKILRALASLELPCQMDSIIDPDQFTFNKFFRFYMHLMKRGEIKKLFDSTGGKHRRYLSCENMKEFIKKQNDSRADPLEMDYYDQKAKDVIKKYKREDVEYFSEKAMCDEAFLRYLLSFDNLIIDPTKLDLYMDMDKPLAHYFISSSHNTYLTGSQITGRASVEMYRQVLLTGCRCIELDILDSELDEPEIKHKNTPVKPVLFIEVIVAIREYAFKVTPYPLILSLENHCGSRGQSKMAQYLIDVFGDMLVTEPLKTHPCEENHLLPSPNDLKYKILIKNKKLDSHPKVNNNNVPTAPRKLVSVSTTSSGSTDISTVSSTSSRSYSTTSSHDSFRHSQASPREFGGGHRLTNFLEDGNSTDDDTPMNSIDHQSSDMTTNPFNPSQCDTLRESTVTKAMSDLVHYVVPIPFTTFARAEERKKYFEMSSFSEDKAQSLVRDYVRDFFAYNQRQLSRIYPRGSRWDSKNFNPYLFWPVGCQMVALNYQTLDVPMQVNLAQFSFNGACGYLEKPASLCQSSGSFDPKFRTNVENVVGCQLEIKILSGQFLCQDREPIYVDIKLYETYADTDKLHKIRIRSKQWNGFQAIYDYIDSKEFSIRFSKIILPEMAALRFTVSAEDGTFIGQSFIPVAYLRPGYRHIALRNQMNIPVQSSSLFIFIRKNIYINAEDKEFADKLFAPLSVQYPDSHSHINEIRSDSNIETTQYDSLFSHMPVRIHASLANDSRDCNRRRSSSTSLDESISYQKHLIASSLLHDKKNLCKLISLKDIEQIEDFKRYREEVQGKIRRVSTDYQKAIRDGEDRFRKYLDDEKSLLTNPSSNHARSANSINKRSNIEHIVQIERSLLDLYSKKLHTQEELECTKSNEYYNKLEKYIKNIYIEQIKQINLILEHDESRVNERVQLQIKQDLNTIETNETNREKINISETKSYQIHMKVGTSVIKTLKEMHEQLGEIIQTNLQRTLNQLEEKKQLETENCLKIYSNRFNEIKHRLQHAVNPDEYDIPSEYSPSIYRSRMTSASVSYNPQGVTTPNQQQRRQTLPQ